MAKRHRTIGFFLFFLAQLSPLLVILYFIWVFNTQTENAGWMLDKDTGCKCWSSTNFEHRSFKWTGDCVDGFVSGSGVLTVLRDGYQFAVFEGFLLHGKAEGPGRFTWPDGDVFEGNYKNGLPNGFGRFYNDDGDYYEGNFENGRQSGQGIYWYESKSPILKFDGTWVDGYRHGQGTLYYRNGSTERGIFHHNELVESDK